MGAEYQIRHHCKIWSFLAATMQISNTNNSTSSHLWICSQILVWFKTLLILNMQRKLVVAAPKFLAIRDFQSTSCTSYEHFLYFAALREKIRYRVIEYWAVAWFDRTPPCSNDLDSILVGALIRLLWQPKLLSRWVVVTGHVCTLNHWGYVGSKRDTAQLTTNI